MSSPAPLTNAQVQQFDGQGYLVVPEVFSEGEIEEIKRGFEGLTRRARAIEEAAMIEGSQFVVSGDVIHRVVWCGACEPVLLKFGGDQRLVSMAKQLLETNRVQQLINQAHFKYPGDGVVFQWHQDSRHRRYGTELWSDAGVRGSFVETATAIDPMTETNGPLRFIPGSHTDGHIPTDPDTGELPTHKIDTDRAQSVTMEPGSVALFGPYTIHSSGPNQGSIARRLFLNGFAHPEANRRDYPGDGSGRFLS